VHLEQALSQSELPILTLIETLHFHSGSSSVQFAMLYLHILLSWTIYNCFRDGHASKEILKLLICRVLKFKNFTPSYIANYNLQGRVFVNVNKSCEC
jgi:hypothetical protein